MAIVLFPSPIQTIHMIRVLAWVSPSDAHLARGQVDHQRGNGALAVHRVDTGDVVIANGVRQIHMILLDRLQGLDRMGRVLAQ